MPKAYMYTSSQTAVKNSLMFCDKQASKRRQDDKIPVVVGVERVNREYLY